MQKQILKQIISIAYENHMFQLTVINMVSETKDGVERSSLPIVFLH